MSPPSNASGVICPTTNPCVPPLNLPSVIKATEFPNPAPMIAPVGFSISGIPGAPLGPIDRITTTSPARTLPDRMPWLNAASLSNTLAGPSNRSPSFPVILATLPFSARLPYKICKCPFFFSGFSTGRIIFCTSKSRSFAVSKFSATVLPVTVKQSPCSIPLRKRYFMTAGTPPWRCKSPIRYLPLGLKSASKGTRLLIS